MTFSRTLALTLAILAFAAPTALGRPSGPASAAAVRAQAKSHHVQDPAGPVFWSYGYEAPIPDAAPAPAPATSVPADDGLPWTAFVAIAGACLLGGALTVTILRTRVRARVSA
jgi:hypothetical protein